MSGLTDEKVWPDHIPEACRYVQCRYCQAIKPIVMTFPGGGEILLKGCEQCLGRPLVPRSSPPEPAISDSMEVP